MVAKTHRRKEGKAGTAALIKALNHPLRAQLLTVLTERVASPNELAKELDEGLSQVSYHVTILKQLGLIELQDTKPRRGAVEHYYRAVARPHLDTKAWTELDPVARQAFSGYIIETLVSDVARAFEGGTFDRREDRHLSRTPLLLDEEGWREVVGIQDSALEAVLDAQAASAERMNSSDEEGIQVIAGMTCFEVPVRPKPGRVKTE